MVASHAIAVRLAQPAAVRLVPGAPMRVAPAARPLHRSAPPPRRPVAARALPRRQAWPLLPAAIFALKLAAIALAGATATLMLVPDMRKPVAPGAPEREAGHETTVYAQRRTQHLSRGQVDLMLDRSIPINFPRRVQTVRYSPPAAPFGAPPLAALPPDKSLPPAGT